MMIYTLTPETADMAGMTLAAFLGRVPSSDRAKVQGLAEFLKSVGRVNAQSLTMTIEADED